MNQYIQVSNLAFARNLNGSISVEMVERGVWLKTGTPCPPEHAPISLISPEDAAKLKAFFTDEN